MLEFVFMKTNRITYMSAIALLLALNLLTSGCGKKAASETTAQAAIQPGADLVAIFDAEAARKAPIQKQLEKQQNAASSLNPLGSRSEELEKKIKEATGLGDEEFKSMVVSMNMSNIDFQQTDPEKIIGNMAMAAAFEFTKSITGKQLKKAADLLLTEAVKQGQSIKTTITEDEVAGRYMLRLDNVPMNRQPTASGAPGSAISMFFGLSKNGKVVFVTLKKEHLSEIFDRVEKGRIEKTPESLAMIAGNLPEGTQLQLLFTAPEKLKQQIRDHIQETEKKAAEQPGMGMQLGFIKPFEKLQSIAFGTKFSDKLEMALLADLGASQSAQQVSGMLNGMVVPMISSQFQQNAAGQNKINFSEMINVTAPGTSVKLEITMTAEMLESAQTTVSGNSTPPPPSN